MTRPRETTFRLEDVWAILRKRAWIAALTTFMAIIYAGYALSRAEPQYVASAEMLMGGQPSVERSSTDLLESRALTDTAIKGELAILESSTLLVRVAKRLSLDQDPEFNPALLPVEEPGPVARLVERTKSFVKSFLLPAPSQEAAGSSAGAAPSSALAEAASANQDMLEGLDGPVSTLARQSSVRQLGNSYVIEVTVASSDPTKAAGIANTIAVEYIEFVGDRRFEAAQRFTVWLETRVAELAASVQDAERQVIAFKTLSSREVDSAERLDQQMEEMTTKLVDARTDLAQTEALAEKARQLLGGSSAVSAASVLADPLLDDFVTRLSVLRQDAATARARFGEESIQVRTIQREAEGVQTELTTEVERVIEEFENRSEVLRTNVSAIRSALSQLERTGFERSADQIELNQLERVADANRRLYEDFLGRFKESSEIQNLRRADAEIISYAAPPGAPATPRKKQTLVLATAAGLFVGLGLMFLLELLPKRFVGSDHVTRSTGLKVYGHLPRLPRRNGVRNIARLVRSKGGRTAMAARNMLRTLELGIGRPMRSVTVVSQSPGGDKTSLAMLLAWAACEQGKTCLLVDGDLRVADLTRRFGLSQRPGLLEVFYGDVAVDDAIFHDPHLGVDVMPTKPSSLDPATIFGMERAEALFQTLMARYDLVIIDSPALNEVSDVVELPQTLDVGLYVIRSGRTPVQRVLDRLGLFKSMPVQMEGAVLSRLQAKSVRV
ncbi:hypothetical protein OCH239_12935 [Roseivivax halodurans JCM 10272]|uniref:Tyrosine-protein kinase G-rich domain-containing protein n=2 Tax=Roseivivax halodurans TaxID=93683 RepID=X7EAQ3_9RHOB|nr:hypothetical protein OCH239_12935 [Roseivivax halodurans JCM 10272]